MISQEILSHITTFFGAETVEFLDKIPIVWDSLFDKSVRNAIRNKAIPVLVQCLDFEQFISVKSALLMLILLSTSDIKSQYDSTEIAFFLEQIIKDPSLNLKEYAIYLGVLVLNSSFGKSIEGNSKFLETLSRFVDSEPTRLKHTVFQCLSKLKNFGTKRFSGDIQSIYKKFKPSKSSWDPDPSMDEKDLRRTAEDDAEIDHTKRMLSGETFDDEGGMIDDENREFPEDEFENDPLDEIDTYQQPSPLPSAKQKGTHKAQPIQQDDDDFFPEDEGEIPEKEPALPKKEPAKVQPKSSPKSAEVPSKTVKKKKKAKKTAATPVEEKNELSDQQEDLFESVEQNERSKSLKQYLEEGVVLRKEIEVLKKQLEEQEERHKKISTELEGQKEISKNVISEKHDLMERNARLQKKADKARKYKDNLEESKRREDGIRAELQRERGRTATLEREISELKGDFGLDRSGRKGGDRSSNPSDSNNLQRILEEQESELSYLHSILTNSLCFSSEAASQLLWDRNQSLVMLHKLARNILRKTRKIWGGREEAVGSLLNSAEGLLSTGGRDAQLHGLHSSDLNQMEPDEVNRVWVMLGGAGNGGGGPEEVLELAEEANASLTEFFAQQSVSADSSLVLTLLGMGVAMGECVDALLVMLDERERDRDNVGRGDWQKRNFERSSFEQRRGREGRDDGWEEETNRDQHRFRNREERHAESPPKSRKNFGKDEQISPSPQKRHFPNSTTPRSDFERTPQKSRGGRREIEMERGTPDRWGKERERDGRREVESPGQHSSETESPSERRMERSGRRVEKKEYAEREEKERKRGKWEEDERSREDKGGRDVGRRRNEQIERGRQGSGLKGEWRGSNEWEDSDENRRNKERQRGVIFDQKMADRQDEKKPQESRHSPHKHRHSNSPQDHTPQPSPPRRHDKHDSSQRNTPRHHPQEASRNQRTTPDKTLQNSLLRNSASISTDSVHSLRRKPLNLMANSESDSESTDGGIGIVRGRKDLQRQERQRSSPYAGKHS